MVPDVWYNNIFSSDINVFFSFSYLQALKSKKGIIKKSIFASPDSTEGGSGGRVGVGTCGTGGQPMTKFDKPTQHYMPRK